MARPSPPLWRRCWRALTALSLRTARPAPARWAGGGVAGAPPKRAAPKWQKWPLGLPPRAALPLLAQQAPLAYVLCKLLSCSLKRPAAFAPQTHTMTGDITEELSAGAGWWLIILEHQQKPVADVAFCAGAMLLGCGVCRHGMAPSAVVAAPVRRCDPPCHPPDLWLPGQHQLGVHVSGDSKFFSMVAPCCRRIRTCTFLAEAGSHT